MSKLTQDSAISLSLAMVLCGVIWKASVTHSMAASAISKVTKLEDEIQRRRDIDDQFKQKVITDLATIKERLGVREH